MNKSLLVLIVLAYLTGNAYSQCSNPYAGQDTAFCGNTGVLSVENATTGFWTAYVNDEEISPAPSYSPLNSSSDVTVIVDEFEGFAQIVAFVWTDDSGPCNDTVLVEFLKQPQAYAGDDFDVCGDCGELNASLNSMSGFWIPNGTVYDDYTNPNTEVCTPTYGDKTYRWYSLNTSTVCSKSCQDYDEAIITFWREPTASIITALADSTACGLVYYGLAAETPEAGVNGYWHSLGLTIEFDPELPGLVATSSGYGYRSVYRIEETGPALDPSFCADTAGPLLIHFLDDQPLYAGYDEDVFSLEHHLTGFSTIEEDSHTDCIYLWENDDVVFDSPSSLETLVTVPEYGTYEFVLNSYYTNMEECTYSDTIKIRFINPIYQKLNGDVIVENDYKVFPNPSIDYFTIQSDIEFTSVKLYDLNGKLVLHSKNGKMKFDISDMEQGIYLISLESKNKVVNMKLVKQ